MKGLMLTFVPHSWEPDVRELVCEPPLEEIKAAIGGGWLELVPDFNSITVQGTSMPCFALCDEDGKGKQMQVNSPATILWNRSLREQGHPGLRDDQGFVDWLVGPVVVFTGDDEFLCTLRDIL